MKQTRTQDISNRTQQESAPGDEAAERPVSLGRGILSKAGVFALLLGLPFGASRLTAGDTPKYRFTEITLPGPGVAFGINDEGVVTGYYIDPATGDALAFVVEHGAVTTGIAGPGATYTSLGPANNWGVESGNYGDYTNQRPVFRDIRTGTFTLLPEIPGRPMNLCDGINDFGHASGVAYAGGNFDVQTGLGMNWVWDGKDYNFFTVPGAVDGAAAGGINDSDQVAGLYVDSAGAPHGFVKDGNHYITLDAPDAVATFGFGINNLGEVAGQYVDMSGNYHGYFWADGTFVTVDTPIADSAGAAWFGCNDYGDLAGVVAVTTNFVNHAVIAERLDKFGNLCRP